MGRFPAGVGPGTHSNGSRSEDGGELFKKGRLRRGLDDKAQLTFQPVSLYRHETTINNRL